MPALAAKIAPEPPGSNRERQLGLIYRVECDVRPWPGGKDLLRRAGLRPTRQRMALSRVLFAKGARHFTAEMLHAEAIAVKIPVSLATIYNTLHQFTQAGLLRQIGVDGSKFYFDTNATMHDHFFVEGEDTLVDIPKAGIVVDRLPNAPDGYEIARVDVVVRLRRKSD